MQQAGDPGTAHLGGTGDLLGGTSCPWALGAAGTWVRTPAPGSQGTQLLTLLHEDHPGVSLEVY